MVVLGLGPISVKKLCVIPYWVFAAAIGMMGCIQIDLNLFILLVA